MNKIKGFEADNLAGLDPANKARWVLDGDSNPPKDFKCKVCTKTHAKFKCEYKCKHCKRKGSHLSENCFFKNKKEADPEKEKNKRDRSSSRGDQRRQRKKGRSPKPTRGRARRTHSESESEVTDRDSASSAQEDNSAEDDQSSKSRRVKNRTRRLIVISDSPPVEEAAEYPVAPPLSGNRTSKSSYRKLLASMNIAQGGVLPNIKATLSCSLLDALAQGVEA